VRASAAGTLDASIADMRHETLHCLGPNGFHRISYLEWGNPHAERVVATDVNERALAFAAFNLALNGVENVELRAGSFLEPVAGEQFDLVVANPPWLPGAAVSPLERAVYDPGGAFLEREPDELAAPLDVRPVIELEFHMRDGGL